MTVGDHSNNRVGSLPFDEAAEQSVIGSILIDSTSVDTAIEILHDHRSFYLDVHRRIFEAIENLYAANKPIDLTTVASALGSGLEHVGGRSYLADLATSAAIPENMSHYCETVLEKYKLRRIIAGCNNAIADAQNGNESDIIINQLEQSALDVHDNDAVEIKSLGQLAVEYVAEITSDKPRETFLETQIPELNNALIGLFRGDLCVIAGPPSMGKSSFALHMGLYNCLTNKRTLYFAIDETNRAMVQRVLAGSIKGDSGMFHRGGFSKKFADDLVDTARSMISDKDTLMLIDKSDISVMDIRSICRRVHRNQGLDMVIVDYIQQLKSPGRYERRDLEVGENSRMLKSLAKELNVAVVALSQLNREYSYASIDPARKKYGFPKPSQLRDSGAIEQDANVILFVWNVLEAMRKSGISQDDERYRLERESFDRGFERAFIVIGKNKMGQTGSVECKWYGPAMQFYSAEIAIDPRNEILADSVQDDLPF